ncbi:MAG: hypothetical protein GC150_01955 [Rhizobiales bacterium]|nr:hypothetical protein [Hyphomicrobiales bacterium]
MGGNLFRVATVAAALLGPGVPALADPADTAQKGYVPHFDRIVTELEADAAFRAAFKPADAPCANLDEAAIVAIDKRWRAGDAALIDPMLASPLARHLATIIEASKGRVTEIILMDVKGCNIAVHPKTTDYWQGDEDKWQKTYAAASQAVFEDRTDFDDSTQTWSQQLSRTLFIAGKPVGAITIGFNIAHR